MVPLWRPLEKKNLSAKTSTAPARVLTTFSILPTLQFWSGPRPARSLPSHTHRRTFCGPHARPGSRATFRVPQNSFVWENKKIDSRPPNGETILHAFLTMGAHMKRLDETSRMVLTRLSGDACGRQESRICIRYRVGSFSTYPVPPDQLQGRQISSYPVPPDELQGRQVFSYPVVLPWTKSHISAPAQCLVQGRQKSSYPIPPRIRYRVASFSATL